MATFHSQLEHFLTGDASFRLWGSGIAAAIQGVGFTKTGDTGQIDFATVARPSASNFAGYEMYAFSDTLQATLPVFIKVEYGVTGSTATPALRVSVGTATDGAGTLSGQLSGTLSLTGMATVSASLVQQVFAAGSSRRLTLVETDFATANKSLGFGVERTVDSSGNATADGYIVWALNAATANTAKVVPATGAISGTALPLVGGAVAGGATFGAYAGKVFLAVPNPIIGKSLYGTAFVAYVGAVMQAGGPFTARVAGADRVYLPLGTSVGNNVFSGDGVSGWAPAMRYE